MKNLRVAGVNYLCGLPFSTLSAEKGIIYEENLPTENARKLNEKEVDVALVSVADFARHGGYLGLDFGICCRENMPPIKLLAQCEIEQVNNIYLYEGSAATTLLLSILLFKKWQAAPRLLRVRRRSIVDYIKGDSAGLIMDETFKPLEAQYYREIDLVDEWIKLTGTPFTFLVWATRPGTLSLKELKKFQALFHKSLKASTAIARIAAAERGIAPEPLVDYITKSITYYFDESIIAGINRFFELSQGYNLLPKTTYISPTFALGNYSDIATKPARNVEEILKDAINGYRLGIEEAIFLAETCPLSDLALVADLLRIRMHPQRSVTYAASIEANPEDESALLNNARVAFERGINLIRLQLECGPKEQLTFLEHILPELKRRYSIKIEALSAAQLMAISREATLPMEKLIAKLLALGLNSVEPTGGEMLVTKLMQRKGNYEFTADDWLSIMKWLHRFGGHSSCCLGLEADQTWEDRILHLQKLRSLQDESPGFERFYLTSAAHQIPSRRVSTELRLRVSAISRLFLDNIAVMAENEFANHATHSALGLCFGADSAEVETTTNGKRASAKSFDLIRGLWNVGMDFETHNFKAPSSGQIH